MTTMRVLRTWRLKRSRAFSGQTWPGTFVNLLGSLLLLAGPCCLRSQEHRFVNARLQTRPLEGGLARTIQSLADRQEQPAWIAYAVPIVDGNYHIGGSSTEDEHVPLSLRRSRCKLEGRNEGMNFQTDSASDPRERSENLLVLYRVAARKVGRIRVFTDDCELDAGGLVVHWLSDVPAADSVAWLETFVNDPGENSRDHRSRDDSAITAIALHAGPEADRALRRFVEPNRPEEIRKSTAFWLGSARGRKGYEVLRLLVREDPSEKVREQCIFALHISKVPDALNTIIEIARQDQSAHLRGQALFWLSQKAGDQAAKAITDAIQNDPETEVKKKAVFALSQLPKDQGVPKLIQVARTNRNQEVRKDAMFWLGQSNDQRALAFFEEVLVH